MEKFKEGDILKPSGFRKTSAGFNLKHLKKVKVISTNIYLNREEVTVKIVSGSTRHREYWRNYDKGDQLTLYADAFELAERKATLYPIY